MGSWSIWHWLIVLVIVLVLFGGGGKITRVMGDLARGVNAFKKNIKETDPNAPANPDAPKTIAEASNQSTTASPANPQPSTPKANANP
ncbi:MAG TPA: twin-arginine translocase TatA/TatE family subunit [Alphaproteobacteria bacterium]|jgi:sec-independent protein translocase protein TatA